MKYLYVNRSTLIRKYKEEMNLDGEVQVLLFWLNCGKIKPIMRIICVPPLWAVFINIKRKYYGKRINRSVLRKR